MRRAKRIGWLERQIRIAQRDLRQWPKWLRPTVSEKP